MPKKGCTESCKALSRTNFSSTRELSSFYGKRNSTFSRAESVSNWNICSSNRSKQASRDIDP